MNTIEQQTVWRGETQRRPTLLTMLVLFWAKYDGVTKGSVEKDKDTFLFLSGHRQEAAGQFSIWTTVLLSLAKNIQATFWKCIWWKEAACTRVKKHGEHFSFSFCTAIQAGQAKTVTFLLHFVPEVGAFSNSSEREKCPRLLSYTAGSETANVQ